MNFEEENKSLCEFMKSLVFLVSHSVQIELEALLGIVGKLIKFPVTFMKNS